MKSENIAKHFQTLHTQRNEFLPHLHSLSQEQLWYRKRGQKWSTGEHFYHLYLIARMLKVAIKFSLTLIPYAKLRKTPHLKLKYTTFMPNTKRNMVEE